jgi:hypothetical protein
LHNIFSLLYRIIFILLHYYFIFTYIQYLVLEPLGGVGDIRQGDCFAGCLMRTKRAFSTVRQEFDINTKFLRGENLFLLQHSALGVPTKWYIA